MKKQIICHQCGGEDMMKDAQDDIIRSGKKDGWLPDYAKHLVWGYDLEEKRPFKYHVCDDHLELMYDETDLYKITDSKEI